jgi:hypothetical protein
MLVESLLPLKGLLNEDVTLRVCTAVQPARATGIECWFHVRAIARVVEASAGIVEAEGGRDVGGVEVLCFEVVGEEVWAGGRGVFGKTLIGRRGRFA